MYWPHEEGIRAGETISVEKALDLLAKGCNVQLATLYVELWGPSDSPDGPPSRLPAEQVLLYLDKGFRATPRSAS